MESVHQLRKHKHLIVPSVNMTGLPAIASLLHSLCEHLSLYLDILAPELLCRLSLMV